MLIYFAKNLDKIWYKIYSISKQPVIRAYEAGCLYRWTWCPHQIFWQILPQFQRHRQSLRDENQGRYGPGLCVHKERQMGQKDLAAKQFECSPEVFADIVNALIFEGEQVVLPGDLQPAPTESLYPAVNGILHNQYNDVSKYEMKNGRIAIQYTLENQSRPDYKILLRKAGYEGAIYRQQYNGRDLGVI